MITDTANLIRQPTAAPTRKVVAGGVGTTALGLPLSQIIVWSLGQFGVDLTPDVAAAIATLVSAAAGFVTAWLTRERAPAG